MIKTELTKKWNKIYSDNKGEKLIFEINEKLEKEELQLDVSEYHIEEKFEEGYQKINDIKMAVESSKINIVGFFIFEKIKDILEPKYEIEYEKHLKTKDHKIITKEIKLKDNKGKILLELK